MQVSENYIIFIILCLTAVFLLVAFYIVVQVINYARKKKKYEAEKNAMNQLFEEQLIQTKLEVQEQTLQNFAADLHDNIGQLLSLTNVTLASVNVNVAAKTASKISSAQELIKRAIKEIRILAKLHQGESLMENGLSDAISQEVQWFQRNAYFKVEFKNNLPDNFTLSHPYANLFVYRLLQECLSNFVRHADATEIFIFLGVKDDCFTMEISDNGKGFRYNESNFQSNGMGINNMQKRIQLLNGTMRIMTAEKKGTRILLNIPCN
jgi:signal transduction histidine kinase